MLSSRRRRRNKAAIPRIPSETPPINSQLPALTPCLAGVSVEPWTGRSAIGTVGTAESDDDKDPAAGGGVVDESVAAVDAAAGAAAGAAFGLLATPVSLLSFVFGSFTALARALCVDDEDEVEDVDVCAGAALEDEVSLGETVVNAGRFGTGVTGAAGAASVEDGGCGVGA